MGDREAGIRLAVEVAGRALESPGSMALPALAILAPAVAGCGDWELRKRCLEFLAPFSSTSIVMGFGIAALGPTWRFMAALADDAEQRIDLARECLPVDLRCGATLVNGMLLARFLADEPLALRQAVSMFLQGFRSGLAGGAVALPRVWAC